MQKYQRYKKVNLEWLDEIPYEWQTIQIKQLKNGNGTLFLDGDWIESDIITDSGIRYLTTGNIGPGYYKEQGNGFISEETFNALNCTEVFPGDLVISRLNEPVGRACIIPDLGYRIVTAVDNVILRPKAPFNKRYLMYVMNSPDFSAYTSLLSRGATMKRISRGQLGSIKIPFPSEIEQYKIASFLDYHTSLIDNVVAQREKQIELLVEKRSSIIYEAVTKGIKKDIELKMTNGSWVAEVPESWNLKRLKFLFSIKKEIAGVLGYDVLSVTQKGIKKRDLENLKGQLSMDYSKYQVVSPGDFIMNHMDLLTGFIDISQWPGVTSPDYRVFSMIDKNSNSRYYLYLFQLCYSNKIFYGLGQGVSQLGRWRLSAEEFNNFVAPVPSLQEQDEIVEYLDHTIGVLDSLIESEELAISKLEEYRQALISEAITGKADLTRWVPKL